MVSVFLVLLLPDFWQRFIWIMSALGSIFSWIRNHTARVENNLFWFDLKQYYIVNIWTKLPYKMLWHLGVFNPSNWPFFGNWWKRLFTWCEMMQGFYDFYHRITFDIFSSQKIFRQTPSTEELLSLYGKYGFRSSLNSGGLSKTSFTNISRHASRGSIGKCDFV